MSQLTSTVGAMELAAVARLDVLAEGRRIDWGTAFLVAPRHALTALHVVAKQKTADPEPRTDHLQLVFTNARQPSPNGLPPVPERRVHLVARHSSADTDWALLEFDPDQEELWGVDPLLLRTPELAFATPFQSFGYARTNPADGIMLSGHIENARARADGAAVIQLFSVQVAASEARVAGQSGAPVFSDGAVVGVIRSFIERDGVAAAGTLYASPVSAPLADPFVQSIARTDPCVGVPAPPEDQPLPAEPFRYLERYHGAEARLFFGRCRELKAVSRALAGERRVILLYGQSGVGKSSLLEAGVEPRMRSSYDVRIVRRTRERGLAGDLGHVLGIAACAAPEFEVAWTALEAGGDSSYATARPRPMLVVLDQVEEAWTRPRSRDDGEPSVVGDRELDELLALLCNHQALGQASTRVVLAFRKDWLPEVDGALQRWGLAAIGVRIAPLDADAIEEIVLGIPRTPQLAEAYGLSVAPLLARRIASDLTRDVGSAIAPALRVVLTNLWRAARERDRDHPSFDQHLYELLVARGLGLDRFLDERLNALASELQPHVNSGFALDVLEFHTTRLGTSEQRDDHELEAHYGERSAEASRLREALRDAYLIVDAVEVGDPVRRTRLAHDMLGPLVRARFAASQQAGPRARRILEARGAVMQGGEPRALDRQDLKIVERGLAAMRSLTPVEVALVERSRRARRRGALIRLATALGAAGLVTAGFAVRVIVARSQLESVSARAAVVSAEAAKQRLEKAAACACAIVRFTEIPGLTISSISQVRDPTEYEDSDEAALHAAIPQRFPDSRTEYKVTWFGKEALLPSGSYVLSYRVGGTDALMMISSGGTGRDFVVTPPIPEERPGFRFVGAGDHCGGRDVRMAPFLIRQTAEDSLLDWPTAHFSAARLHGRLPTTDELLCAAKLGMLPGGTDSWSWSFEANPAGTLDGGHQVVRHNVVRGGRRDGRALLHVTRPIGRVASELAIKVSDRQTTRERPLATTNTKYSSSTTTEATSVPAPSPLDVENLALALADTSSATIVIEGAYCDAWTLHDRLVETGVAAESIWVDARERSDKDPTAGGRTVMTRLGTRAPAVSSVRDQARLDKTCHPRIVVTDTSTEVLDIVSFVTGTPTIQRASEPILDAVVATLEGNPSIQLIEVQGHVFEGPRSQRMALSTRRAARVRDYLLGHGVAASRVVAQGYGDSQSLTCSTDLATMVRRGSSIAELRRSEAWSPSAENEYLVGKLEPYCRSGSIKNTRIAFAILKRAEK